MEPPGWYRIKSMKPSAAIPEEKSLPEPERGAELPFFYFVSLVLTGITVWAIYSTPALQQPVRGAAFALLMALHIGLYWISFRLPFTNPVILAYLLGQGVLAFILNLLGQNPMLSMGLYMGLVGMTVGMLGLSLRGIAVIAYYMLLSFISFGIFNGWQEFQWWLLGIGPTLLFVIIYVTLYNRQTIARAEAQQLAADLEQANQKLTDYAAQVEALTITSERQRMARELHDTLSQGLAGLILQLEAADAHLGASRTDRARTIIQSAMTQARSTLSEARRAIDDLRQSSAEELRPADFEAMLHGEAKRFTEATGIPCRVEADLSAPVSPALCEPVQRMLAEALTNVARHARAAHAAVTAASRADGLRLTITDDGVGFDPSATDGKPGHYGLLGIRERVRLAGGTFELDAQPGTGTTLRLYLPYTNGDPENHHA